MIVRNTLIVALLLLSGCSIVSRSERSSYEGTTQEVKAPGVVDYVWEEPMVDVVEVPPGLDPEGTYYRPSHQQVIEIRQGRWQYEGDKDSN